ncbi:MAG: Kojibiose phosphorylase [Herbinix sp.]|jgi:maltose phosphorylase|nr:Kojibiose phosphorylase [Herbinix sp.]
MAKIADKYYVTDPWNIIEEGFDPAYSQVSESIFSLGNEYMGIRGYFEEGYQGESLIGSYFNGIYESVKTEGSAYKGIIDKTEFMVNSMDWLYMRIQIGEELLRFEEAGIENFKRSLNLRTGILSRSYDWVLKDGRRLRLEFERFLSMKKAQLGGQSLTLTPLNFSGEVTITAGLDFTLHHNMVGKNLWSSEETRTGEHSCSILANTVNTGQSVYSLCHFTCNAVTEKDIIEQKKVLKVFTLLLNEGEATTFSRLVMNVVRKDNAASDLETFNVKCNEAMRVLPSLQYSAMKEESASWWDKMWVDSDIVIDGDELNQQGIRYCIFQMHQTYHGADRGTIIGAKGLTGEAYSGNTFWDTETYCLPFYIFNNVEAAKHLLEFRNLTLQEAKERAKALDCEGAFYPIATISGRECCSLWQHASLQLQASTAVAYGIKHFETVTKEEEFVFTTGLPILIEVSRMLASRGAWNADHTRYGYYGVMGPDEFQMMVNNNCYTNFMGKVSLEYTLEVLNRLQSRDSEAYDKAIKEHQLTENECANWKVIAENMYIPYDDKTKLFEQHEGYFTLPHIDVDQIPVEDFPLYHHWSYDRIYRNDMIKQPDVLMMMLLYNGLFTKEQLRKNYEFYEPRCIHESSLSPSVHSILAAGLQKHEEAYKFFGFATRMDLDNYNRNTAEGLHTTSIAAAWMNIVYGFGGMRSDQEKLSFSPSIPASWNAFSFRIHYKKDVIQVAITQAEATFYTLNGTEIEVVIYDQPVTLGQEMVRVAVQKEA